MATFAKFCKLFQKTPKNSAISNEKIENRERCKGVHCGNLGESFQTHILLRNLASIQPRTSPVKFHPSSTRGLICDRQGNRSRGGLSPIPACRPLHGGRRAHRLGARRCPERGRGMRLPPGLPDVHLIFSILISSTDYY